MFAFHSLHYGQQGLGDALFLAGASGVSFFYVVSGFVMSWTARAGDTAGAFYQRRFARIYPAYAVAWLISLGIMLLQGRRPSLVDLIPLTLTQSWVPSETVFWATNAVFWSLSCEAFFYLVFPLLHRRVGGWTPTAALVGIVVLVLAVEGVALAVHLAGDSMTAYWASAVFPVTRLAEFVIGVLLGVLAVRGARWSPPLWSAVGITVAAFVAANHVPDAFRDVAVTLVPFALLVWAAAQADLAGRRSIFRSRTLVALGTWSYAFYLVHTQAMTAWFEVLDRIGMDKDTLTGVVLFLSVCGAFVCALLAAWLLHHLVEVPMERRLRPRSAARRTSLSDEEPVHPVPVDPGRSAAG